jgi:hypothetical protein
VRSTRAAEIEVHEEHNYRKLHLSLDLQMTLIRKKPAEIVDEGFLPGDRRGAAGLDTIFFKYVSPTSEWLSFFTVIP